MRAGRTPAGPSLIGYDKIRTAACALMRQAITQRYSPIFNAWTGVGAACDPAGARFGAVGGRNATGLLRHARQIWTVAKRVGTP